MASAKIVNAGFAIYTNLISGLGGTVAKYGQMGTGVTGAAAGDTALGTPTNDARVAGTQTRVTTNATNDTVQNVFSISSGVAGPTAVTEVGEFDGAGTGTPATGANMADRATFSAINLSLNDSIQFTTKTVLTSTT